MILNSISEDAIKALLETKQDKLTGAAGQVLGFDASGNPVAQAAPEGGVTSFNGRTGAITPQDGDYTAEQVGALPLKGGTLTGAIRQEPASSANASMLACKDTGKRQVVFDYLSGYTQFMFAKNFTPSKSRAVTVSGVADPTNAYDAANKNYVDTRLRYGFTEYEVESAVSSYTVTFNTDIRPYVAFVYPRDNNMISYNNGIVLRFAIVTSRGMSIPNTSLGSGYYTSVASLSSNKLTVKNGITYNGVTYNLCETGMTYLVIILY